MPHIYLAPYVGRGVERGAIEGWIVRDPFVVYGVPVRVTDRLSVADYVEGLDYSVQRDTPRLGWETFTNIRIPLLRIDEMTGQERPNSALLHYPEAISDPFRPRGSEQPGWSAIDLRPDSTILTGRGLVAVPVRDDTIGAYLGDAPDEISAAVKKAVQSRFGITLEATRLRQIIPELLIAHAREDGTRWRPLRAMRDGMFRIYLGGLWWQARSLAGGSMITESFNKADSDILGPDLSWTELVGDIDIVSNHAQSVTVGSQVIARADSDLATDDHYAQALVDVSEVATVGFVGVITRKDSSATATFYLFFASFSTDVLRLYKNVSGAYTQLGTDIAYALTMGTPVTVKGSSDGPTQEIFIDGVSQGTRTDMAITGNLRTGIRGNKLTAGYVTWDNFQAGDLFDPALFPRPIDEPGMIGRVYK